MKKFLGLLTIVALFLSGCASYYAAPLAPLEPEFLESTKVAGVSAGARVFSKTDCKTYLDRDLLAQGIVPIQLSFYNQSDQTYLFSNESIGLNVIPSAEVANQVHTSTVGRAAGYGVAALLFPVFVIPAVVDGICSHTANKQLDQDFERKTSDRFVLHKNGSKNLLIFVYKEDFAPKFNLTLIDQESRKTKTIEVSTLSSFGSYTEKN